MVFMKRFLMAISFTAIALCLFLFNSSIRKHCFAEEYKTFSSPNGEYHVVVYKIPVFPMMMPGSTGDSPGFVRLYGEDKKTILEEEGVEMVQLIEDVEWRNDMVYMKLFTEWDLPAQ